jgi:hypothetical protein
MAAIRCAAQATKEATVTNARPSSRLIVVLGCLVVGVLAGCATIPTADRTVAVPTPAPSLDLLDVAADAAKAVGLPAVTKLDRAGGVVEFGTFEAPPSAAYAAQVRRRPDGGLDVTVKRGSGDAAAVEDKAKELVAAIETRLRPPAATPPAARPAPASPEPPARSPSVTPSTPSSPAAPPRAEPAPAPPAIMLVVSVPRANLRERGAASARLIKVLPRNTRVTVLGKANQWYLVRLDDGTEGWLAESVTAPAR